MTTRTHKTTKANTTHARARAAAATATSANVAAGSAQFARYLPMAMALAASDVKTFRADVSLATLNAARGAEIILDHASELAAALPRVDLSAVRTLGDLGSAVAFAAARVERFAPTPSNVKALLADAHRVRSLMMAAADMLVLTGVFPASAVAKIRKGHGPIDTAGDCVALAALFVQHGGATSGKVAVTADDIKTAEMVGTELLRMLRPSAAKKPPDKALIAAADARDRLWTLFVQAWENNVWRAGAWLFGIDVDKRIPRLNSRRRAARALGTTPPPPAPPAAS